MIIRRIRMVNFRGFRDKTISFDDKPVVLLSAANGIGKTSTIDAIEWCLTGKIGRLKTAFDNRSTNSTDRSLNTGGILKNSNARANEKVIVTLWLFDGCKEAVLRREQRNDEINPAESTVTLDESEDAAKEYLREFIGDSFYNYHICDVQKSFNVQNTKRKDLKDLFGEFITNYDGQKQITETLCVFADDVERYISDIEKPRVSQETIATYEEQIKRASAEANANRYPQIAFYSDEDTDISHHNKDQLLAQKEAIKNCGYLVAKDRIYKLGKNEAMKNQVSTLQELASYWMMQGPAIREAIKAGFAHNTDSIRRIESKLLQLRKLSLTREVIFREGDFVIALGNDAFAQPFFDKTKETIAQKEQIVRKLDADIELLTHNNQILRLFSSLSANKKAFLEYREHVAKKSGNVRCPVCGAEAFARLDESLILREADLYIKQNGETVREKENEKNAIVAEIDVLYQEIIHSAKEVVENEINLLEGQYRKLNAINTETNPYFVAAKKFQGMQKNIKAEDLDAEKITRLREEALSQLLEEDKERDYRFTYQQILTALGYDYENEPLKQTYERVKSIISSNIDVIDFSYDVFVAKLTAIDSLLANHTLSEYNEKIADAKEKNRRIDAEIAALRELEYKAKQKANDITSVVTELAKEEYEKVGPALLKYYNKLSRFDSSEGIQIIQKNDGISLVDDKGKNIVNVLSNGQISVFILAHFFAGISARNDREKMKVFFIDDLTSCMDDVNMLAFMDLLKYQMSTKATMEQLFFITCDNRISRLLKYKMSGREIQLCELTERDFAQG